MAFNILQSVETDGEVAVGGSRKGKVVARTSERPRGRSVPKWGRYGLDSSTDMQAQQPQHPPPAHKWGPDLNELTQVIAAMI